MSEQLYSSGEVAKILGETRHWMTEHVSHKGSPIPPFKRQHGTGMQHLWRAEDVDAWRAYHAGETSLPNRRPTNGFSDHNAVNRIANTTVTWKLWWRCTFNGGAEWFFSTPTGWWTSSDDGRSWASTNLMARPSEYRYYSVNGAAQPRGALALVLRSAEQLRQRIDR